MSIRVGRDILDDTRWSLLGVGVYFAAIASLRCGLTDGRVQGWSWADGAL